MKATKRQIERDGSGSVTLIPEEPEDMWHAYNLIRPNDLLRATAMRRVVTESLTGASTSKNVSTTLTIKVTALDFDTSSSQLHVSGRVAEENAYVRLGGHHTLDLEINRAFTLEKGDGWDSVAVQQLKDAIDTKGRAELWAILMNEGLANICVVSEYQTKLVQQVVIAIPKKRAASGDYDKAIRKFYGVLFETLSRAIDLNNTPVDSLKPLLLASPGFTAQNFLKYIKQQAETSSGKTMPALLEKITVTHAASANLSALAEILKSTAVTSQLRDTKFARETQLLDKFYESLRKDDGKAWYGPSEVFKCVEKGAVGRGGGVLLISNNLFRSLDIAERKKWVGLVDRVREVEGGEVRVLSEAHESGKRLETLGGVGAMLTYPIFDLDEEDG
jgi:protein pelota